MLDYPRRNIILLDFPFNPIRLRFRGAYCVSIPFRSNIQVKYCVNRVWSPRMFYLYYKDLCYITSRIYFCMQTFCHVWYYSPFFVIIDILHNIGSSHSGAAHATEWEMFTIILNKYYRIFYSCVPQVFTFPSYAERSAVVPYGILTWPNNNFLSNTATDQSWEEARNSESSQMWGNLA